MKNITPLLLVFFLTCVPYCRGQESGFVETQDGKIHYKTYGAGDPLLIINGGPGLNCEGFGSLAELLADKNKAILFDQRGTGESSLKQVDESTVTMDLMVRDIESLREHLKIKNWIVLGHSFGGILAHYYASKHPESVKGMILSSSGGIDMEVFSFVEANMKNRLSDCQKDSLKYWQEKIKEEKKKNGAASYHAKYEMGMALAPAYLYDKKFVPLIADRLTQGNEKITGLVYKDLYKIKYDCKESLKDFDKPVLIIQGRQDIVGDGTAYKSHAVLKNSTLVFLNECVHYGWLEQKEKYMAETKKFIDSVSSPKPDATSCGDQTPHKVG